MPSIFKYNQRKRRSSTCDASESPPDTPSPIPFEYEQTNNQCQIIGNTSFISRRLSPPCRTDQSLHPLSDAARKGDLPQLKELLIQFPNDINRIDSNGYTPLFYGIYSKNADVVEYLLDHKANYRHQAVRGITAFHYCINYSTDDCFAALCRYAKEGLLPPASPTQRFSLDISDNDGLTPLMLACRMNRPRCVHLLLEHGVDPILRSFRGDTAMTIAVQHNAVECVKELAAMVGFIDSRSKFYPNGALFTAARMNEQEIVRCLVGYPKYFSQFIKEMLVDPSRSEEIVVEVALRELAVSHPQEVVDEIASLCTAAACHCMKLLFEICKGRQLNQAYSLAGLAEVAKWCIKLSKVLSNSIIIPAMDPYWRQIEHFVIQHSQKHLRIIHTEAPEEHHESVEETGIPKIVPNSSTKLLLSFLEMYVLGHYDLSTSVKKDKEESLIRLRSISCLHSRLIQFFSNYKEYLLLLVEADPDVYNMLHFFKHSFTLFLQNC